MGKIIRNQLIKAIKNKFDLRDFHHMKLQIKNDKVRYNIDDDGWYSRDLEPGELEELEEKINIVITELEATLTLDSIYGTYINENGKTISFNF